MLERFASRYEKHDHWIQKDSGDWVLVEWYLMNDHNRDQQRREQRLRQQRIEEEARVEMNPIYG